MRKDHGAARLSPLSKGNPDSLLLRVLIISCSCLNKTIRPRQCYYRTCYLSFASNIHSQQFFLSSLYALQRTSTTMDHAIGLNILKVANTILGQIMKNGQNITLPLIQFAGAATNRLGEAPWNRSGGIVRLLMSHPNIQRAVTKSGKSSVAE